MSQRSTPSTIGWYRTHETSSSIGFDPDGMCQKICRTARNIGPGAASAIASQHMTPTQYRVHDVAKITRGMVVYFDDTHDSNPYGHIVTVVGRVPNSDRDSLGSLLVRTNSVISNRVVVVRGDYFGAHWGDEYQFAGEWLNGVALDLPDVPKKKKPKPPPPLPPRGFRRLERMVDLYDEMIDNNRDNRRVADALRRDRKEIRQTIRRLKKART